MYLEHFNLRKRPFATSPDPAFLIWSAQHQSVLDAVLDTRPQAPPVSILLGDIGLGKSTLAHALQERLIAEQGGRVGLISVQLNTAEEAIAHALRSLEGQALDGSAEAARARLEALLADGTDGGCATVLIVDEAQSLSDAAASALLSLVRDTEGAVRCRLLLVGLGALEARLASPALEPFEAELRPPLRLRPVSKDEAAAYVSGRLARAGHVGPDLFTPDAVAVIHRHAEGVPRLINKACDLVLLTAAQEDKRVIEADLVREILRDVSLASGAMSFPGAAGAAAKPPRAPEAQAATGRAGGPSSARPAQAPKGRGGPEIEVSASQGMRLERALIETLKTSTQRSAAPRKPAAARPDQAAALPEASMPEAPGAGALPSKVGAEVRPVSSRRVVTGALVAAALVGGAAILYSLDVFPVLRDGAVTGEDPRSGEVLPAPDATWIAQDLARDAGTSAEAAEAQAAVAEAEQRLQALQDAAASAEAELAEIAARLDARTRELASVEEAVSEVQSVRVETDAELDVMRTQIDAEQARLARLQSEAEAAEAALATLAVSEKIADDAFAAAQTVSNTMPDPKSPDPVRLQPQKLDAAEATTFFLAALESDDPAEVAVNYSRAALRGHTRAASFLAQLYETGDGVPFAPDMAARWYAVAEEPARILAEDSRAADVVPAVQSVVPLGAAVVAGTPGEFVWQGVGAQFILELADTDGTAIAFAETPLSAVAVSVPEGTAQWRVRTDGGAETAWQPIAGAGD